MFHGSNPILSWNKTIYIFIYLSLSLYLFIDLVSYFFITKHHSFITKCSREHKYVIVIVNCCKCS